MAELHISSRTCAGVPTVTLSGDFDSYSAPRVRVLLETLTAGPSPCIRIHLAGLEYIDSTGLGVLVATLKQVTDQSGRLELIGPTPPVLRILHITGLDKIFSITVDPSA